MPIAEFGKNRSTPDGYTYYCRRCCRKITTASYHRCKLIRQAIAKKGNASGKLKLCRGCNFMLPYKSFRNNSRTADGKHYRCRLCCIPSLVQEMDNHIHSMGYL